MIEVKVLYFAQLQEKKRKSEDVLQVEKGSLVSDVFAKVFPDSSITETATRVAVNQTYVSYNFSLSAGDEIAFIPPVAGG